MGIPLVVLGAGGFAQEVADLVRGTEYWVLGFVVDDGFLEGARRGLPPGGVRNFAWLLEQHDVKVISGVGASEVRRRFVLRIPPDQFLSLRHASVVAGSASFVGVGSILCAGVSITTNVRVGNHVVLNLHVTVGHDAVIEDFASVMPGVNISGNVVVGEGAYIGTGASVVGGVKIGAWSRVGAGAAVIEDVPSNATVVGVPGRVVKTRSSGWHL